MEKTMNEIMNEYEAAARAREAKERERAETGNPTDLDEYKERAEAEAINELQEEIKELKIERTSLEIEFSSWENLSNFYRYNEEAIKNKRNRAEKTIENNIDRIRKDLRAATEAEAEAINELHRMIDNLNKITL